MSMRMYQDRADQKDAWRSVAFHRIVAQPADFDIEPSNKACRLILAQRHRETQFAREMSNAHEEFAAVGGNYPSDWYEKGLAAVPTNPRNGRKIAIESALKSDDLPMLLEALLLRAIDCGAIAPHMPCRSVPALVPSEREVQRMTDQLFMHRQA
jgi:hypothetical protein